MARPPITAKGEELFRTQLDAALDYVEGLAGSGSVAWGGISGTLSDQTDLQTALDGKSATAHTHANATTSVAGFMSAADKTKLDGVESGAQANVATDLSYTASTRLLASSTGADVTLPLLTSTDAGLAPASGGGTSNFLRADGTWASPASGSLALTDLTDVTITSAAEGQSLVRGPTEWINQTYQTFTLGPFYINDMAASATTQATLGYFNTATALSRSGNDILMQTEGRVVGVMLASDAARTAGGLAARVRIAGVTTAFNSDAVSLDVTNTTSNSSFVSWANGLAFSAGQTLGAAAVSTAGWTPVTANLSIWLVVMMKF